jgi:hypothetical protein
MPKYTNKKYPLIQQNIKKIRYSCQFHIPPSAPAATPSFRQMDMDAARLNGRQVAVTRVAEGAANNRIV